GEYISCRCPQPDSPKAGAFAGGDDGGNVFWTAGEDEPRGLLAEKRRGGVLVLRQTNFATDACAACGHFRQRDQQSAVGDVLCRREKTRADQIEDLGLHGLLHVQVHLDGRTDDFAGQIAQDAAAATMRRGGSEEEDLITSRGER